MNVQHEARLVDADIILRTLREMTEGFHDFKRIDVWDDPPTGIYELQKQADQEGYLPTFLYLNLDTGKWTAIIEAPWRKSRPYRSKDTEGVCEAILDVFSQVNGHFEMMKAIFDQHID